MSKHSKKIRLLSSR